MTPPERLDGLYQLLPPIYRDRDAEQNYPLRDLLRVIGEQVLAVEADVAQLYDNWFIETCADWVVPYIGDLIGYQPVREAGEASTAGALGRALTPRREVANTIRFRRRKGTLAVLEELSRAIAGWPARAAEYDLARKFLDVRDGAPLDLLGTPFDAQPHLIDVRQPASLLSPGVNNIPAVLLHVWRLQAFRVTRTRAYRLRGKAGCFRFSLLGNDEPILTRRAVEEDENHLAEEINVPAPIRRRALRERVIGPDGKARWAVPEAYYGEEKSFAIYAPHWPGPGAAQPVPRELIFEKNLTRWHEPPPDRVFVDPVLGRVRFPCGENVPHQIQVTYHYGFAAAIGGGEYPREIAQPSGAIVYTVGKGQKIGAAIAQWKAEQPQHAVIEITASGYYPVALDVEIAAGRSLQVRAASGVRPVLEFDEDEEDAEDALVFSGQPGSRLTLDGLLIVGAAVRVRGPATEEELMQESACPFEIVIRHCTLVPGLSFDHECDEDEAGRCDCEVSDCEKASLELLDVNGCVTIERSILGTIRVEQDEVETDPLPITVHDSIVDCARHEDEPPAKEGGEFDAHHAIFSKRCGHIAHAALRLARCTIFGWVRTHAIVAADGCIFTDRIQVARRQLGCMRFCYVPPDSRTPRRYQCQPERAVRALAAASEAPPTPADEDRERARVVPQFAARRFGKMDYARLAQACADEIKRGAEDESEMGVFHDLYDPQRADNLRTRLAEFVPADSEAGVLFVT